MFAHAPSGTSLEERVAATLSAELAAVFSHQAQEAGAHAHLGLYDEPEPENEDDEDEPYSSGPERGPPPCRSGGGSRPPSPLRADRSSDVRAQGDKAGPGGNGREVQVMIVEGLDGQAFSIPLRARKGKEPVGASTGAAAVMTGVKRKR